MSGGLLLLLGMLGCSVLGIVIVCVIVANFPTL